MTAKQVFLDFMTKMCEWETYAIQVGLAQHIEEHRKVVEVIFNTYCTKKDRKQGKPSVLTASPISNYDIETQPIYKIDEIKNKVIIYTKQTNKFENNFRYTLISKNGKWLIDKKEISYDNGDSWESAIL